MSLHPDYRCPQCFCDYAQVGETDDVTEWCCPFCGDKMTEFKHDCAINLGDFASLIEAERRRNAPIIEGKSYDELWRELAEESEVLRVLGERFRVMEEAGAAD